MEDAHHQLEDLRARLERDYVSISELSVWLGGLVVLMVGLHFGLRYLRDGNPAGSSPSRPATADETAVWVGRFGRDGYALLQVPVDSSEAARAIDQILAAHYGRPVRSYWLGLYSFGEATLELAPVAAQVQLPGQTLATLPPPAQLPPALSAQLGSLLADVALPAGQSTRALLVFPEHDATQVQRLQVTAAEGAVVLEPARWNTKALQDFHDRPDRSSFESAHRGDAHK